MVLLVLVACTEVASAPTQFPTPQFQTTQRNETISTAEGSAASPSAATATTVSAPSPTPDAYRGLTIDELSSRKYGGGGRFLFSSGQRVPAGFTRYTFEYPSDGLLIHGFLNLPDTEGPHPVVLVLHGYIDPEEYELLPYTTRYADALATTGYLVLHPSYRNYPPSDPGPNLFRVGYAVDVMNLIALVQENAGQPGPLESADPDSIGLFGHSMGGGITLRAITAGAPVQAAVLYGSMSPDEQRNYEKIYEWSDGKRGLSELSTPPQDLARISPLFFLDRIQVPVSIHHGEDDDLVPPEWSTDLCRRLKLLGKSVECFTYPNEPHTFIGFGGIVLMERTTAFFEQHLRATD
jgi:dipeptidyl aminopeptidase/acylaminoacyl peptidase